MELLYRYSGLNGRGIGWLLGLDYSTVSIGRKRLIGQLEKDEKLADLFINIEKNSSITKI